LKTPTSFDGNKNVEKLIERRLETVKNIVVVLSGKGGVGKSTVTAALATALSTEKPSSIGVLDADFGGAVVPMIFGVEKGTLTSHKHFELSPVVGPYGLKFFSYGFLLGEKVPVTMRGVTKYQALRGILSHMDWGKLEYLLIDMPPGTADDALNIAFALPRIEGAVIVTAPSRVSNVPVSKSVTFCEQYDIRVLGVIENMSSLVCPHCGGKIKLFGASGKAKKMSREAGVPFLGQIPFDERISKCMDEGVPYLTRYPGSPASTALRAITNRIKVELTDSAQTRAIA
jgi:ATP-binding protein involved in chromosome partitioning